MATAKKTTVKKKVAQTIAKNKPEYTAIHKAMIGPSGIKVGNTARITRQWIVGEMGYEGQPCSPAGCKGTITSISETSIGVKHHGITFQVPIYVVENLGPQFTLGSSGYTAQIGPKGLVTVNCTTVPFELLTKIYNAAKEAAGV